MTTATDPKTAAPKTAAPKTAARRRAQVASHLLLVLAGALAVCAAGPARAQCLDGGGDVLIILDNSGSMRGEKWQAATDAIELLVGAERDINWGLLLFNGGQCGGAGQVVVPVGPRRAGDILTALAADANQPGGGTAIEGALRRGGGHLADGLGFSAIILITDGQESGCDAPDAIADIRARREGLTVYVIGFGAGVDAGALAAMARAGSDDPAAAPYLAGDAVELRRALLNVGAALPDAIEICNGLDDDCDERIDEGVLPEVGDICETGEPGICADGLWSCEGGMLLCVQDAVGGDETCDGLDNDCDGEADEDLDTGGRCATGLPGVCAEGEVVCSLQLDCQGLYSASAETCDGRDDDCDGSIDEGLRSTCGTCDTPPVDTCDGVDQDCDGEIDEDPACPVGDVCHRGACRTRCVAGECIEGMCDRSTDLCLARCEVTPCPDGQTCDRDAEQCVDPCAAVECAPGEVCRAGDCAPPRPAGCEADPCRPNPCEPGAVCHAECDRATCRPSCATVSCPLFSSCIDGACVEDPCGGVECWPGSTCVDGECAPDPCGPVTCDPGMACLDGFCQLDPCSAVVCPAGEICRRRAGRAQCVFFDAPIGPLDPADAPPGDEPDGALPDATGDGPDLGPGAGPGHRGTGDGTVLPVRPVETVGCSCSADGRGEGPAALLLVGILALGLRRPRRGR